MVKSASAYRRIKQKGKQKIARTAKPRRCSKLPAKTPPFAVLLVFLYMATSKSS